MDISREYITRCHAAIEVQKQWNPKKGDTYYVLEHDYVVEFKSDIYQMNQWKKSFYLVYLCKNSFLNNTTSKILLVFLIVVKF